MLTLWDSRASAYAYCLPEYIIATTSKEVRPPVLPPSRPLAVSSSPVVDCLGSCDFPVFSHRPGPYPPSNKCCDHHCGRGGL